MTLGRIVVRRFSTARVLRSGPDQLGRPLENMPFKANNKYLFTLGFALFCGSGLSAPFIMVRHQLLKK